MKIKTQQDMVKFCEKVNNQLIRIDNYDACSLKEVQYVEEIQDKFIEKKILPKKPISHLQQGIKSLELNNHGVIALKETPLLFPNPKLFNEKEAKNYLGAITGVLVNCYDADNRTFLFHMRGRDIDSPFGFQGAAAGMGRFREMPYITAKKELEEEAGSLYPLDLFQGRAIGCFPFIKSGKIPQPLLSFGFANDLSRFPQYKSLEDITEFEEKVKKDLKKGILEQKEAYPFTLPYNKVEKVIGEINDLDKFVGPIYHSTINFIKTLRDYKYLE